MEMTGIGGVIDRAFVGDRFAKERKPTSQMNQSELFDEMQRLNQEQNRLARQAIWLDCAVWIFGIVFVALFLMTL